MIKKDIISDLDSVYNYVEDDKILGFLEIRIVDGVLDIINLFVNEENRKNKIATKLMKKMIDEEDYNRIMLEVNEKNIPAIKLYSKLGFKEISMRERYYDSDSAIIMEKVK